MLWCTTPSGKKWSLLNPDPMMVDIQDIATNLARQVRFNGSCGQYTIAEHSVHMHDESKRRMRPANWQLHALLHDAHEAYLGDWITPGVSALGMIMVELKMVKNEKDVNQALTALKTRMDDVIFPVLGLNVRTLGGAALAELKSLDAAAMMTERDHLSPVQPENWGAYESLPRLNFTPQCWSFEEARGQFLERFSRHDKRAIAAE